MKSSKWISAYENNVDVGLACGFSGKAQIGKAVGCSDMMKQMIRKKSLI